MNQDLTIQNNTTHNNANQAAVEKTTAGLRIHPKMFLESIPHISYKDNALCIENVEALALVKTYGTPLYVYSKTAILDNYNAYNDSFSEVDHQVHYAVKANSNLAVLSVLAQAGAGFDLVSKGELARVLAVGASPSKIVFSGVGKTREDIQAALEVGIGCFNVESLSELDTINTVAQELGTLAPISIRVNPDVDAKTHPYISTGLKDNKFGIGHDVAVEAYRYAKSLTNINITGIDFHIGSQLTDTDPFVAAIEKVSELIDALKAIDIELKHINLGGGLGVIYTDEDVVSVADYAAALLPKIQDLGLKVMFEPGRSIVANAGVLLTTIDVLKPTEHKNFAIVDAAMNDLIRPALYQAQMAIIPTTLSDLTNESADNEGADAESLSQGINEIEASWDIVGAICETSDFLAKDRLLSSVNVGDVLAVTGAGAYSFVMSSNYNTRPRAAEVMVEDGQHQLVRKRETIEALFETETLWQAN